MSIIYPSNSGCRTSRWKLLFCWALIGILVVLNVTLHYVVSLHFVNCETFASSSAEQLLVQNASAVAGGAIDSWNNSWADPNSTGWKVNSSREGQWTPLQECQDFIVRLDPRCPRLLEYTYTANAGFGHQFSEFLFGLRKARNHGMTYLFTPFQESLNHGDEYTFIDELFGLSKLFESFGAVPESSSSGSFQHLPRAAFHTNSSLCHVVYTIRGYLHCDSEVEHGDCFKAAENKYLFQDVAGCLRASVQTYGSAPKWCLLSSLQNPPHEHLRLLPANNTYLPNDTVFVVLHVRAGDFEPHLPHDIFYNTILKALRQIATGYKIQILLVGKGPIDSNGRSRVPDTYLHTITAKVLEVWNESSTNDLMIPQVRAPSYTFSESLLSMMQADILIGSGSSLPVVASLVSGIPLFFNHVAKHGYNFGMEMVGGDVDMESDGQILESYRRLEVELYARLHPKKPTPCRGPK